MKRTAFLLFLLPIQVFCQVRIFGTVKNQETNNPVEYATVYANNTSIGILSDSTGNFSLANVPVPCELIFSHVGYETMIMPINEKKEEGLNVFLVPKKMELKAIEVKDKNLREKNVKQFANSFLGDDYWGKHATIENDSVLNFGQRYNITEPLDFSDSLVGNLFYSTVKADVPLKIKLPLLGYELYVDLVHYSEKINPQNGQSLISCTGYYFFKPDTLSSASKQEKFSKNRLKVYYNSDVHFCRSLFEQKLNENGYQVNENYGTFSTEKQTEQKIKNHMFYSGNELKIVGLKGDMFRIHFYDNIKGEPINLSEKHGNYYTMSKIYFTQDTCIIRENGTLPDNSIVFDLAIGSKRVGAKLPENYNPNEAKPKK